MAGAINHASTAAEHIHTYAPARRHHRSRRADYLPDESSRRLLAVDASLPRALLTDANFTRAGLASARVWPYAKLKRTRISLMTGPTLGLETEIFLISINFGFKLTEHKDELQVLRISVNFSARFSRLVLGGHILLKCFCLLINHKMQEKMGPVIRNHPCGDEKGT